MTCKRDECKHYEFWDSSFNDEDGYHEHVVEFCHRCKGAWNTHHSCVDCESWEGYEDHECNWKFEKNC